MHSSENLKKEVVPKLLQMYTKHSKNMVFTSLPPDPESIAADPDPPYFGSLPTDSLLPTIEKDTSTSSDLNLPITHQKGKRFCTQILFLIMFSMIVLSHYLVSLLCIFLLFLYLSLIRKH